MQVEKTVFISYRRTNVFVARAVYQDLTAQGYDCFLDYESIDSGAFDQVILNQVAARAHFIVILTASALERCNEPNDWLRREIEYALEMKRNIVPLMFEQFSFADVQKYLTGKLAVLQQYNALEIPTSPIYFKYAMKELQEHFLNKSLDVILHPTPKADEAAVEQAQAKEAAQSRVSEEQLTAEQWAERAFKRAESDYDGKIADYSEAIRLNGKYSIAYNNRGNARYRKGDIDGAITDFSEVIRLNPKSAYAYISRGIAHYHKGNMDAAIADYDEAIKLDLKDDNCYNNRGEVYFALKQYDKALIDFKKANDLKPGYPMILAGLAITNHALGILDEAKRLWNALITIDNRYRDVEWVKKELGWVEELAAEARKLTGEL